MKPFLLAGVVFAVICAAAPGAPAKAGAPALYNTEISGGDLLFLTGGARTGVLLVRLSNLAGAHAVTPEVKELAAAVEKDQTAALARMKEMAARKQVSLPEEPDAAGGRLLQHAGQLNGPKFDKTYLDALSEAQRQLAAAFEQAAHSSDAAIKAFATAAQPALQRQTARARRLGGN